MMGKKLEFKKLREMDEKNKITSLTRAFPLLKPAGPGDIVKREKNKDFHVDIFAPQFIVIDSFIGSLKIRYPMNKEKLEVVTKFLKAEEAEHNLKSDNAKKPDNTMD